MYIYVCVYTVCVLHTESLMYPHVTYPKLSMLVIFAYIPMLAWEANIGMLAPGGYIRRISSYFCRNLVILPEFIGKCKFILLRAKLCCQKVMGQSLPTS